METLFVRKEIDYVNSNPVYGYTYFIKPMRKVYIPTGQQVTVLIDHCGSVFAEPEKYDATVQKITNPISATVIVPQISDAINALIVYRSLGH